ncbi:O-antigen polymerase [Pseudarthrobacter sp. YS3]|uniref:O-antigen polymerase n=1 Tax=Pseudarthrobacter sp. YS3 TaxID=3453718 RepID=UPI003EED86C0
MVPIILSLVVWSIPGESLYLRGFGDRADVNLGGVLLLLAFYATVVFVAVSFAALGKSLIAGDGLVRARSTEVEKRFYLVISLSGLVGVVAAYSAVSGSVSIVDALSTSSANVLSEHLADGSSLATLRYATAMAAPVGLYLYRKRKVSLFSVVINCLLLIMNALLTSRLSLVMAIVVFFFLMAHEDSSRRFKPLGIAFAGLVIFAALTIFNFVRNGNYYRLFGVDNPIAMNVYQIMAYVGAPGQVSLGVASSIFNGKFGKQVPAASAVEAVIPTFLRAEKADKSATTDPAIYGYNVDIAPNLNTNSAFADTYAKYGWWGLVAILVLLASMSLLFGIFSRVGGVYAAGAGVIGYGFAEFWRLFLFSQGISVFLVLLTITSAVIALGSTLDIRRRRNSRS